MKKFFSKLCFVLGGALVFLVLLVTSIEVFALNPGFYEKEYNKLKQNEVIGISRAELTTVTKNLLDYTEDKIKTLDMQATINGQKREVFNDKEKSHMVDVKALYLKARDIRNYAIIAVVILVLLGVLLHRPGSLKRALKSYLWTGCIMFALIAAISVYASIDFYSFWTSFHELFFTNNLWLLDPSTDILIMMVPGEFFSDLVMQIIILFVSVFAASEIASAIGLKIIKKHERLAAHV